MFGGICQCNPRASICFRLFPVRWSENKCTKAECVVNVYFNLVRGRRPNKDREVWVAICSCILKAHTTHKKSLCKCIDKNIISLGLHFLLSCSNARSSHLCLLRQDGYGAHNSLGPSETFLKGKPLLFCVIHKSAAEFYNWQELQRIQTYGTSPSPTP